MADRQITGVQAMLSHGDIVLSEVQGLWAARLIGSDVRVDYAFTTPGGAVEALQRQALRFAVRAVQDGGQ